MWKACKRTRVVKWFMWLGLKWNEYAVNAERQSLSYLQVQRAQFIHLSPKGQLSIVSDVTSHFMLDYVFQSRVLPSGRAFDFSTYDYDPLRGSTITPGNLVHFMTVTYSVNGHRLTALYQQKPRQLQDNQQHKKTATFPPYGNFSAYEGLKERQPLSQKFTLSHTEDKKKEEMDLNVLLDECRGPGGHVSATPTPDWIASDSAREHSWPLDLFIIYAASQTADQSWMMAVEQHKVNILGTEQIA